MIQHSQVMPPIERKRKKGSEPSDDAPESIGSPTSSEDADQCDDDAEEEIVEYVEDTLVEYVADVEYSPTLIMDNTYVDDQDESNLAIIPSTNSSMPPTHCCTTKKRRLRRKTPQMAATTQGKCSAPHWDLMAWVTDYVDAGIRYHLASKGCSDIIELN